jgi:hypothetical protein
MKLSELQSLINKILESQGDMDVIRIRSLDIDGIVSNISIKDNTINYSSDNFNIIDNNDTKYFIIGTPLYDND